MVATLWRYYHQGSTRRGGSSDLPPRSIRLLMLRERSVLKRMRMHIPAMPTLQHHPPSTCAPCVRGSGAQCKSTSLVYSSALAGTGCQTKARSPVASSGMGPSEGPSNAVNKFPQVLASRRDAPRVQYSTKGNLEAALAAVSTEEARAGADAAYRRDMYSTIGLAARSA